MAGSQNVFRPVRIAVPPATGDFSGESEAGAIYTADGSVESHHKTMSRLVEMMGLPGEDMFKNGDELIDEACALRESKIAYVDEDLIEQA